MTDALKPCPFCGSTDLEANHGMKSFYICRGCSAYGPDGLEAWNTRADTATPAPADPLADERVRKLVDAYRLALADAADVADAKMKKYARETYSEEAVKVFTSNGDTPAQSAAKTYGAGEILESIRALATPTAAELLARIKEEPGQ